MAVAVALTSAAPEKPHVSARTHNQVLDAAQARVDTLEPRLASIIETILNKTADRAASLFHERVTRHPIPDSSLVAAGPNWSPPFPDELIDVDALVAQILDKTEPVRKALIEQTMTPALKQAGLDFDVSNPLTAKLFADTGSQVTNIAMTTRANLMSIIGKSYQNGLTIPATRDLIQKGMRSASKARATMIARTEMARAVNGGSLVATQLVSQATGQAYNKVWHTTPGAKYPRHETYADLDGQTVGQDEAFNVGGDDLQYPGDPNGEPSETINCRCSLSYQEVQQAVQTPSLTEDATGAESVGLIPTIESDLKKLLTDESGAVKLPQVDIHVPNPDVTTPSVEEAAKALSEGKKVSLTNASEINTFIDDLGKMAADAQKAGKAAPNLDLGKVSVPGTNLFTQDSLGIPRVDMPQLAGIPVPGSPAEKLPMTVFEGQPSPWRDISEPFFQSLRDQGIKVDAEQVNPETLRATQSELNGPKIAHLMDEIEAAAPPPDGTVFYEQGMTDQVKALYAEQNLDTDTLVKAANDAVKEDPMRLVHGNTGDTAFWISDGKVYAWKDYNEMTAEEKSHAVPVHSHSGVNYFTSDIPETHEPWSSPDIQQWFAGLKKDGQGGRQMLLYADGKADIVGIGPDTDPAIIKMGPKTLRKSLEESGYDPHKGSDYNREAYHKWYADHGLTYQEIQFAAPNDLVDLAAKNKYLDPEGLKARFVPLPTDQPVIISSDNYVLDGHHRWAASLGRDYQTGTDVPHPIKVERIDEPITTLLQQARDYSKKMGIPPDSAFDATKTAVTPPVPPETPPTPMASVPEQPIDIGITPFRAGEDNAVGFYDSAKYQQFINDVNQSAQAYGVQIDSIDKVTGVWEGDTEPSVSLHVSPTEPDENSDAYKGQHSAPNPNYGAPMNDLNGEYNGGQIYPDDVYDTKNQVHYYGQGGDADSVAMDKATFAQINSVKGDPTAMVTIYRGVPGNVTEINPGDWVTTSKEYAEHHADANLGQDADGHVISMQVPAGQLWTDGNSIQEWGWIPPNFEQFNADARAQAFAANLGKAYNQDGVIYFAPDPAGKSIMATFQTAFPQQQAIDALAKVGISGGRFTTDGRLQIIGSGQDFVKQVQVLAKTLDDASPTPAKYDIARGTFTEQNRDKGDYQKALDAFTHPKDVTAQIIPTPDPAPPATLKRADPILSPTSSQGTAEMLSEVAAAPQQKWLAGLTNEQSTLLYRWTNGGDEDINNYLTGKNLTDTGLNVFQSADEVKAAAADLDKLVESAPPLPEGTTLYRGINPFRINPALTAQQDALIKDEQAAFNEKWNLPADSWSDEYAAAYANAVRTPGFLDAQAKLNVDREAIGTKLVSDWAQQQYPVGSYAAMNEPGEFSSLTIDPDTAASAGVGPDQTSVVFKIEDATTGAPIWPKSAVVDEYEVLAPTDTMYQVKSVELAQMNNVGTKEDKIVVTLQEAPKCGGPALTAATGVACTNIAQYVPSKPKPTTGNSVLFPGQPRSIAENAAAHRDQAIVQYAAANHMSVGDYKSAATEAIRSYIAGHPQIRIRLTHQALEGMLDSGRYKSEFEMPGATADMLAPRVAVEKNLFGYPDDLPPANRPVYGYLAGTADEQDEVQEYGDIIMNLNPTVNARATFTIGDSYSPGLQGFLSPSLLSDPGIGSWDGSFDIVKAYRDGDIDQIARYVEVEILGGLPLSDVGGITPDQALIVAREDAQRVKNGVSAITEIYANNKGTQTESPVVQQSGLPTDKPPQFDYAQALHEIGKNAELRQAALADLIGRVGLRGAVADDFQDFNIANAIEAGQI